MENLIIIYRNFIHLRWFAGFLPSTVPFWLPLSIILKKYQLKKKERESKEKAIGKSKCKTRSPNKCKKKAIGKSKQKSKQKKTTGKSKQIAKIKQILFSAFFFPQKMQKKAKQMQKKTKKKQRKSKSFFAFSVAFFLHFAFACFPKV